MSFQAYPTEAGTYRVKVYKTDKDHYWKYIQDRDRWVKLTTADETAANPSSLSFIWFILPVAGKLNTFTIIPAYDDDNTLVSSSDDKEKYWGYGFAQGNECKSGDWNIRKSTDGEYSKIKFIENNYVLDCRDTSQGRVHFYQDQEGEAAKNQRFVFQLVEKGM